MMAGRGPIQVIAVENILVFNFLFWESYANAGVFFIRDVSICIYIGICVSARIDFVLRAARFRILGKRRIGCPNSVTSMCVCVDVDVLTIPVSVYIHGSKYMHTHARCVCVRRSQHDKKIIDIRGRRSVRQWLLYLSVS